jgi:dsDNA-specific endonuclease/ATPase MutS2
MVALTSSSDIICQLQEIIQLFQREQDEEWRELLTACARVQGVLENINNTLGRAATVELVTAKAVSAHWLKQSESILSPISIALAHRQHAVLLAFCDCLIA